MLQARARQLDLPLNSQPWKPGTILPGFYIEPVANSSNAIAGQLNAANSRYVLDTLDRAIDGCLNHEFAAMVTGPVHKGIINDAGIPFTGHTEYLAQRSGTNRVVMMLACPQLRVALATTHVPLSEVSRSITRESLTEIIHITHHDLHNRFGISDPVINVCGLNPHAGENGHLGHEEIDCIMPVIEEYRKQGIHLQGPTPADTAFTPRALQGVDAVLAMYHDQGLPVLKHLGFGQAVNITLGLPFIRTSVDHGTALDLAGTGNIDDGSLLAALEQAIRLTSTGMDSDHG